MSQKKIFLVIVAVSTVSLLLHQSRLSWTMQAFYLGCPSLRSHPSPGLKPKHTNVAFLKTHKTASSTMQNLLFRFAERHNLTVALPVESCDHLFCYPMTFKSDFVHPHTLPPNIITNHMRFNKAELQRLMPNDTIYITILREPSSMFESSFTYFQGNCESFKRVPNGSMEAFLKEPWRYYRPDEKGAMFARNTLTFDLGRDKDRSSTDAAYMKSLLEEVEQVFSLVMITEYFDESLVLLRHLLSWDLDDILYVKLNTRTESSKKSMTPGLTSKVRAWNSLDARLYDHFNATLWRKIAALGAACVAKEVQGLREAQEELMRRCFSDSKRSSATQIKNEDLRPWIPKNVDIVAYDLPANSSHGASSEDSCVKFIMPGLRYSQALLGSQSLRYKLQHPRQSRSPNQPIGKVLPKDPKVKRSQRSAVRPRPGAGSQPSRGWKRKT